ncbi:glutamate receptor ionotropic, kainate 2-like [Watersipora subatra]|uniref:glutamate receptor ionotropic, kainate 2-like n=1 Tax=Watersipora subatra TaxID=2589382 RepID=UPI00355B5C4D
MASNRQVDMTLIIAKIAFMWQETTTYYVPSEQPLDFTLPYNHQQVLVVGEPIEKRQNVGNTLHSITSIHKPGCQWCSSSEGGIFNEDPDLRLASQKVFEFAVSQVNKRQQEIEFLAVSATAMDVVETAEKSHELVISSNTSSAGVIGLFLVTDQASSDMGASLCERLGIPVIHPLPELSFLHKKNQAKGNQQTMAMHIHPDVRTLSSALLHFVRAYQWGDIVVLYKGTEGLDRIKSVLNAGFLQFGLHEKIEIIFWPMADMQRALKDLRYGHSYQHILVDIKTEDIADFLKAAHKIGMLTSYQHYMFTSLDLGALSLDKTYTSGGVNITGYRLLDEESAKSQEVLKNWIAFNNGSSGREIFEAHHALMVDSVNIYSQTVLDYYAEKQSLTPLQTNLSSDDGFWESGPILLDRLYNVSYEGLTGDIKLVRGKRLDFALELIEYDNLGNVQVVGNWNVADGLDIANSENRRREEIQRDLKNKTLRVVVKLVSVFIFVSLLTN